MTKTTILRPIAWVENMIFNEKNIDSMLKASPSIDRKQFLDDFFLHLMRYELSADTLFLQCARAIANDFLLPWFDQDNLNILALGQYVYNDVELPASLKGARIGPILINEY
jgi:hypothetical protein